MNDAPIGRWHWSRWAFAFGILGPLLGLAAILQAAATTTGFRWLANDLSDLGVGASATWFNGGVFLGGLLGLVFALALREGLPAGDLGHLASLSLAGAFACLAAVGVFTQSTGALHVAASTGFFVLAPLGVVLLGIARLHGGDEDYGAFTVALGVAAALVPLSAGLLLVELDRGIAVAELAAGALLSLWGFVTGARLLLRTVEEVEFSELREPRGAAH